jgi:hypothetical protein
MAITGWHAVKVRDVTVAMLWQMTFSSEQLDRSRFMRNLNPRVFFEVTVRGLMARH